MESRATCRACDLRNSGEAFRQFRPAGLLAGAHEHARAMLRHKAVGAAIAGMAMLGLAGVVATFF